ncbi:hypothetical protein ACHABX_08590 [Nesterenkonia halotolerans]|uniref:hypothetical protein n=1 Tax=Nesterenkonia halotolerans TaxID=225325 RepID=UPI003EE5ECD2
MASQVSLAPVITISRSIVAARSLRYPEAEKSDSDQPRVLYRDGINCRPETAVDEFAQVRRMYHHDGGKALRKVPATYELPEPSEEATHLRKVYPSGRKYWAEPKDGETATHVRREGIAYEPAGRAAATHRRVGRRWVKDPASPTHVAVEGGYVRSSEAINLIYSFDLSSVNHHDSADTERAFHYVRAEIEAKFRAADGGCAVQAKLVAQADAKGMVDEHGNRLTEGGKFHVHVVLNAVQAKDMETDGQIFKAGRKLSAKATDIEWIRDKHDEFAREHPKWGFVPQPKNRQERQAEKRSTMDRRMAASGNKSNHDIIRASYEACMNDARASDLNSFIEIMREDHGVTVNHRGEQKPTLSYRLDDMPQPVRGKRLGDHYDYENTLSQLEAKAGGLPRRRRPRGTQQLPAKPDPLPTQQELDEARRVVAELAYEESLDQWLERRAAERGTTVGLLSILEEFDESDPEDRQRLHHVKTQEEAEQQAEREPTLQASEPAKHRTAESGTSRPEDMTTTPTEARTAVPPLEPAESAAQRTVRRHREEDERRKVEKQPAKGARKPSPTSGLSFTDFGRRRREGSAPDVHSESAIKSTAAVEPSVEPKLEMEVVASSPETSETLENSGALNRDDQVNEKQVDERPEAKKSTKKTAKQLAQEGLSRRTAHLKSKNEQEREDQFD